jgi:glyoxylase-like metal-dependent hydrolase (beta-lactamase superfamily II)
VRLIHPGNAHTAGDTVVVFEKEKVMAAGDLFFNGVPPCIEVEDGGIRELWSADRDFSRFAPLKWRNPLV